MSGGIRIVSTKFDNGVERHTAHEFTIPTPFNTMPGEPLEPIFTDTTIRLGFLRKVFGIFTTQMILTLALIGFINFIDPVRTLIEESVYLYSGIPLGLAALIFIFLLIKKDMTKRFPVNFIFLTLFTLLVGFEVASIATITSKENVLYAGGILLCPTLAVALYTLQGRFDLKWYGQLIIVVGSVGLVTAIIYFVIPPKEDYVLIVSATGSLVISIYLAIFIQSIMSGNCINFSPENYIFVSLAAGGFLIYVLLTYVATLCSY